MTKAIKILILTWFCSTVSMAQNDLVKLKNGSAIRGKIIETTDQKTKIKTIDGSIWVYTRNEIESIGKFKPTLTPNGYYNQTSLGILGGSELSASFQVVNGYSFNPHWGLGVGMGWEIFYGQHYVPLFIEGTYSLLNKNFTPFCSIGAGYDLPTRNFERNKGGLLTQGRIGFKHQLGDHFGLITSAGYRYSYIKQEVWSWWHDNTVTEITEINRFEFRFGFIFR